MNTSETGEPAMIEQALVNRVSEQELSKWVEKNAVAYQELMAYYRCALSAVESEILRCREELTLQYDNDPVDLVRTGIKSADAIVDEMLSRREPLTAENIERDLNDVALAEVVCTFSSKLYLFADALSKAEGLSLLEREDYVEQPRESGYRGLHLLLSVPVTLRGQTRRMKVEVQLRTPAMELWANTERKLARKKDLLAPEQLRRELRECAAIGAELDTRLEQLRYNVEHHVITK